MQSLLQWDTALFHLINDTLSNRLFDALLPWCREKWFWAPVYLFIGAFTWTHLGRRGWWVVLGMVLCVFMADTLSSELIKKNVQRIRPCNDPALSATVRLRTDCGSGYSFTSSHAANHFAVAVFLIGVFGGLGRWVRPAALGWAALIAFSQVYVGVHYPGDVICGGLLGAGIGYVLRVIFLRVIFLEK